MRRKKRCESNPDSTRLETVETRRLSGRDRVMSILEKSLSQSNSGKLCGTKNQ
ncbi:hypothetical protein [Oculatella sp. FACHB-28]|uniref:hypothetical protein n=1 Tax=Oculatella sp. FACHB-28 TaxID=2692845 RepID=UPI00168A0ADB|nr:hypothetical protein [Oculatella sp. FACHB-28]